MSDFIIKTEGLYKKFSRSLKRSIAYGTTDVMRSMFNIKYDQEQLRKGEFWALENINFELKQGQSLGIIGSNGSGKSTLLRLLSGVFPPDSGRISINGKIGALIAVGAGFHPHMTGRENIYLNGSILGMNRSQIKDRFNKIVEFSEIGEFLDAPVSNYSSGMFVRLGFSIAIFCHPEILLIDEILAVGDVRFQRKCLDKIKEVQNDGTTFLLVSHNLRNIETMCTHGLLINKGKQILYGDTGETIAAYELMLKNEQYSNEIDKILLPRKDYNIKSRDLTLLYKFSNWSKEEVEILSIKTFNHKGFQTTELSSDEVMRIEVELSSVIDIDVAYLYCSFRYLNDPEVINDDINNVNIELLGTRKKISISKGKSRLNIIYNESGLSTGIYQLGFCLFDYSGDNPHFQGYYGYLYVSKNIPTMFFTGYKGYPYIWSNPELNISSINE